MDVSRELAGGHGTVICADFQRLGRGRGKGRLWEMNSGENLAFTILLRYNQIEAIPAALTLRIGLAVCAAIEEFSPLLAQRLKIKWPNDIIIDGKKTAGIMCEADGGNVYVGIGINVAQNEFPRHLRSKVTSLSLAQHKDIPPEERYTLLEKILVCLKLELDSINWRQRLEERLFKKGEEVLFIDGAADSGVTVSGRLTGIGDRGELLIIPQGECEERGFITGELGAFL
jgi:BirA family biotin operon repressor/biotin-[acetyl-CoA-carboxylase] ligase